MRLWEELADARLDGMEEAQIASIRNLMKKTGWSAEKAMDMLDIPKENWNRYLKLMEK